MFDHGIEDGGDVVNFDFFGEAIFVDERECSSVYSSKDVGVLIFDVTKGCTVWPFFGFAMTRGDVGNNDTWLIHGGIDGIDNNPASFEIGVVADCDWTDMSSWEKGGGADYLTIHGKRVVAIIDNSDVHDLNPKSQILKS
jgi:hypothetical protein